MPAASSPTTCSASPAGLPETSLAARRPRLSSRRAHRGYAEHHVHTIGPLNQAGTSHGVRQQ